MADYALKLSDVEVARYRIMADRALAAERDHWVAAGAVPGATVADVGCGPGAISVVLAELVGLNGRVIAVERDGEALAAARELAQQSGATNVDFRQAEATATGVEPGSCDLVMMRHVLAHNGGREQDIVDHLATLVRPGGCVYLLDIEGSAARFYPPNPDALDLSDRYHSYQTRRGNDMSIGLRLGELVERAGLELVEHRGWYDVIVVPPGLRPPSWAAREAMRDEGLVTDADIARWQAMFDELDRGERAVQMFMPMFVAVGRR